MKNKRSIRLAGGFALLAAALTVLVLFADVAPIGPAETSVGLSRLNGAVHALTGVHMLWYEITDWLGIGAILTALVFAAVGAMQLICRRSVFKVDREILALGGLYVVLLGLYVLFEKAVVNYRPVIMPGELHPEASFPSSHTMLVCVILGSAMLVMGRYVKNGALCRLLRWICAAVIAVTVVGRLISGVHWFTDILGGILISAALLALFAGLTENETE